MPPLRIFLKTYHKSLAFRHCSLFIFFRRFIENIYFFYPKSVIRNFLVQKVRL